MRYPIYFFVLLTGFFYLTGQPLEQKNAGIEKPVAQKKVPQLKYAKNTGSAVVVSPQKIRVKAPLKTEVRETLTVKALPKTDVKEVVTVKEKVAVENIAEAKWQVSALSSAQNLSSPTLPTRSTAFGKSRDKSYRVAAKKPLDWTVFGNQRKTASLNGAGGTKSNRAVRAASIPVEAIAKLGSSPKVVRKKIRKRRKVRSSRKKRSRRHSRLKRRHKGVRRVARRAKKKSKKNYASYRPRRKKFGFSTIGGRTRLFNN